MSEPGEVLVAVIMGSKADWDTMSSSSDLLADFEIPDECRVLSDHRPPDEVEAEVSGAVGAGCQGGVCQGGGEQFW